MLATLWRTPRVASYRVDPLCASTVVAAWALWVAGCVLGRGSWYWGGLLVTGAVGLGAATVDRLQRREVFERSTAEMARLGLLAAAFVWAPRAVLFPEADVALWVILILAAAITYLAAPWVAGKTSRHELWRLWEDFKAVVAAAGCAIAAPVLTVALGFRLGWEIAPTEFISIVCGAVFCVGPTMACLRGVR